MKKPKIRFLRKLIPLLVFLFCIGQVLHAQQITGKVTSNDGNPLTGVSIRVDKTKLGTTTDLDGKYMIKVPGKESVLVFTYMGYQSQRIKTGEKTIIDVILLPDVRSLGEVVVVAFGTQQRSTLTSSVTQVDSKVLENRPVGNISVALQGQVAGVNITQSSGQPGLGASISIRGVGSLQSGTSPLIIIDGVPGTMSMVNSNDVESISVLKDASACSLYGARAANGVILITTKRGKVGKITVSYSGYAGYQNPTELFKEADAYNYANAYNLANMYDAISRKVPAFNETKKVYTLKQLDDWKSGKVPSTDWRKSLFNQNGFTQSHYVNIAGGMNHENIFLKNSLSIGYLQQNGNLTNTDYKLYTLRESNELKWNKFTFGVSLGLSYSKTNAPISVAVGDLGSIISAVNRQNPTVPVKDENGDWNVTATNDTNNPVRQAYEGGKSSDENYNILANINLAYNITKDLTIKLTNGINYIADNTNVFKNELEWSTGMISGPNSSAMSNYRDIHYMQQLDLNYKKSFGQHNFAAIIGGQQELHTYNFSTLSRMNFINNSSNSMQLGAADGKDNNSIQYDWGLMGVFGRFNYDFDRKYLLEVDFREDGSSRLNPGSNWDFFPSVSGGWRISEESFMSSLKPVLSELKLRGSYGVLGNQNMPGVNNNELYYRYKAIVGAATDSYAGNLYYLFGNSVNNAMTVVQNPNNSCTWERTALTDIAVEGNLYSGLITYSLGYFNKATRGMLMTKQVSAVNGGNNYVANIGKMVNHGLELSLGLDKKTENGFKILFNGNFTYMTNKINDLGGQNMTASGVTKNTVGYGLNSYYIYMNDGLLSKAEFLDPTHLLLSGQKYGDQKLKDLAGNADGTPDGKINSADKVMIAKSSTPKWLYGLNFDFSYKGFGLAGMLQGAAGNYKYLGGSVGYGFNSGYSTTQWTIANSYNPLTDENNYNTRLPRLSVNNTINNTYPSNLFLFDCSYIRLKNIQVYYNFPEQLSKKMNMNNVRVFFSGQNLFTFSALPKELGVDPEIGSATAGYPLVKIFTLGIDVTF